VVRKASVLQERLDRRGATGDVGGVFEQHRVPGHEGGRPEAEKLPERIIPRHYGQNGAERLVRHVAGGGLRVDGLVGQEVGPVVRVVPAHPGALLGLGGGLHEGLAHFLRHERPVPLSVLFEPVGRPAQPLGTGRHGAGSVGRKAGGGPRQALLYLVGRVERVLVQNGAGGGVGGRQGHGDEGICRGRDGDMRNGHWLHDAF
jgi:hypothetical protein